MIYDLSSLLNNSGHWDKIYHYTSIFMLWYMHYSIGLGKEALKKLIHALKKLIQALKKLIKKAAPKSDGRAYPKPGKIV